LRLSGLPPNLRLIALSAEVGSVSPINNINPMSPKLVADAMSTMRFRFMTM